MISAGDVQQGAVTYWNSLGLNATVGALAAGRQSAPATPYAVVAAKGGKKQFYSEGIAGQVYVSWWKLTIEIYGVGSATVDALLKTAGADFDVQSLTVPGATMMACWPDDATPTLEQDPARKAGEDWWIGSLGYDLMLSGVA